MKLITKNIAAIRSKTRRLTLPGFYGFSLYEVWHSFNTQLNKTNLGERASGIAFSFLMAIPAATIFLLTLIPYTPLSDILHTQLQSLINDITPNENTATLIKNFQAFLDENLHKTRLGLLSFGFAWMIFSASNAMVGIIRTFDRSIDDLHNAGFFRKRWRAIKLTVVMLLLLIGSLLILAGQNILFDAIMYWLHIDNPVLMQWIRSARWLFIMVLFLIAIGIIYKYAPSVKRREKIITPGSILATLLLMLFTWLFSVWVNNVVSVNGLYGSIGSVIILMSLIYFNSLVLLVGFELNIGIYSLRDEEKE